MANDPKTEALILGYAQACLDRDFDRIWTYYHDDIVYEDCALGQVHVGIEATKKFYLSTMNGLDVDWVVTRVHATESGFGLESYMEGTHVKDLPGMPATGKTFKVPCASIGEIQDGKIIGNRDYWNNFDLLKQLGLR